MVYLIDMCQETRDPRFLPLSGKLEERNFRTQYSFIADMRHNELQILRENLKRARKLLASSPRDLREECRKEVERLELAVKRAESAVNRDKRETVEEEALSRAAKEERDKRHHGKKAYWMKSGRSTDIYSNDERIHKITSQAKRRTFY